MYAQKGARKAIREYLDVIFLNMEKPIDYTKSDRTIRKTVVMLSIWLHSFLFASFLLASLIPQFPFPAKGKL